MTASEHDPGHGNSVAAWTAVSVITLGTLISAIAFPLTSVWVFWAGVVVIVLGVLAGKVLAMMGFGVHGASAGAPVEATADPPA